MKKLISKNSWILILAALFVGLISRELLERYGRQMTAQQLANIHLAQNYATQKTNEIEGRSEFEHITVTYTTGRGGAVAVYGCLPKDKEEVLKSLIYTKELPTEVVWHVEALDPEPWEKLITYEQTQR